MFQLADLYVCKNAIKKEKLSFSLKLHKRKLLKRNKYWYEYGLKVQKYFNYACGSFRPSCFFLMQTDYII